MTRILLARGPRALESAWLERLSLRLARTPADLRSRPRLTVVVPSASLRHHLLECLASSLPAWAGAEVVTLAHVARRQLDRPGEAGAPADWLLPVLCQRQAAFLAAGHGSGSFSWSARALEASVRDLLDAGFEPSHLEASLELLADFHRGSLRPADWAEGVLRAAAAIASELADRRYFVGAGLYRRAAEALRALPAELDGSAEFWAYGFADATGAAADYLTVLLQRSAGEARFFLDLPPASGDSPREFWGEAFGKALRERLRSLGELEEVSASQASQPAPVFLLRAASETAEVEAAAERIRALLDQGVVPERIAVVVRDLGQGYLRAVRRVFASWAIPYAIEEAPESDARERRLQPFRDWLDQRSRLRIEHAAELLAPNGVGSPDFWRTIEAAHRRGWRDLASVAADARGEVEGSGQPLPGSAEAERLVRLYRELAKLEGMRGSFPLGGWLDQSLAFLRQGGVAEEVIRILEQRFEAGVEPALHDFVLNADEARLVIGNLLESAFDEPRTGSNGGVRVASATAFRGQTTQHLFLLGLRHHLLPRTPREDPLLPDAFRAALRTLLPDLPVKLEGHQEERFLFDQLLHSASEQMVCLEPAASDAGEAYLPSPFRGVVLERCGEDSRGPRDREAPDPVCRALLTGKKRQLRNWSRWFPVARASRRREATPSIGPAVSELRLLLRWIRAREPRAGVHGLRNLLPWMGSLGFSFRQVPGVTRLEGQLRCGWQAYLTTELGLRRRPVLDELPDPLDSRLLGTALHRALEHLLDPGIPRIESLEEDTEKHTPVEVQFPDSGSIARVAREVVLTLIEEEGLGGCGLEEPVAAVVASLLEQARELLTSEPLLLYGVEVQGVARWTSSTNVAREIPFRADRVERERSGRMRIVDVKTGGRERFKRLGTPKHLLEDARRGIGLQAPAYLEAVSARQGEVAFEWISLAAAAEPLEERRHLLDPRAEGMSELLLAFHDSAELALRAREAGLFPPLLLDADLQSSAPACRSCPVIRACLQLDSSVRDAVARSLSSFLRSEAIPAPDRDLLLLRNLLLLPTRAKAQQDKASSQGAPPLPETRKG